ncbi:preprotein translocase subunit YajC [Beduinella massiliensis]|uniref:preprotein translocase subunit YajC n=1 Tax=Beduinella massiliensis TaxID=1852363 RepID=UPI0031F8174A
MMNAFLNLLADAAPAVGDAAAAAGDAATEVGAAGGILGLVVSLAPMILIFVVFYFMLIRPQRKKDKEAKAMLAALKVGDRICTIGGIYGTIANIKDDVLTVEVGAEKTKLVFARWAIRNVEEISISNDAEALI